MRLLKDHQAGVLSLLESDNFYNIHNESEQLDVCNCTVTLVFSMTITPLMLCEVTSKMKYSDVTVGSLSKSQPLRTFGP